MKPWIGFERIRFLYRSSVEIGWPELEVRAKGEQPFFEEEEGKRGKKENKWERNNLFISLDREQEKRGRKTDPSSQSNSDLPSKLRS